MTNTEKEIVIYRCAICGKTRPDMEDAKRKLMDDPSYIKEWERTGMGWYVFSDWTGHDKRYLCPVHGRAICNKIDDYRMIASMGRWNV